VRPGFTHTLPGMKRGLHLHQLWSFFWVFASKATPGIATALLANEKPSPFLAIACACWPITSPSTTTIASRPTTSVPSDRRELTPTGSNALARPAGMESRSR